MESKDVSSDSRRAASLLPRCKPGIHGTNFVVEYQMPNTAYWHAPERLLLYPIVGQ